MQETQVIPAGTLGKWKAQAEQINDSAQVAYLAVQAGRSVINGRPVTDHLRDAFDGAQQLLGGIRREMGPDPSKALSAPSISLEQLDTLQTRKLLALLEEALGVAEEVDAARGRSVGADMQLGPMEPRGFDLAEAIGLIRLRVHEEVYGPSTGGRE
jgi:hypothetical protein